MYIFCIFSVLLLVAADQAVKYIVMLNIPDQTVSGQAINVIPHVLGITHVHNTGGAWSVLSQHTWLLAAVSAAAALVILYILLRRKVTAPLGVWALALVLAGAVGNMIDRIRLGYVVDMFLFLFIRFPVFNVADICVTAGGILLCIYILFFYERQGKG
ncbi:MAG: signal peptidase II [Oscillospiraceae bacterium]|nr:signal peptidase II [Oscillospiraceae bacterium]